MITPSNIFEAWQQLIEADSSAWREPRGQWIWRVTGQQEGAWVIQAGDAPGIFRADDMRAEAQVELSSSDFIKLAKGEANIQELFLSGRLVLYGTPESGMSLGLLWDRFMQDKGLLQERAGDRTNG